MLIDERRSTEEAYVSASNTSNMAVETHRRTDADVIIAAGWSPSRIGSALLRLHSEWDGAEHPKRGTQSYLHEMGMLFAKLKTMPEVRHQLALWAADQRMPDPSGVSASVLLWWLDKTCRKCSGTKYDVIPGTSRQSAKPCRACHGTGEAKLPHGQHGKKMANWMDMCIQLARTSISKRLHTMEGRR